MKDLFTLSLFVCLLHVTLTDFVQSNDTNQVKRDKINQAPSFTCKTAIYNQETNTVKLVGDVSFKTETFNLVSAGKVVYDQKTQRITIYDCKEFTIDGQIVQASKPGKVMTVDYTLGSSVAYVR